MSSEELREKNKRKNSLRRFLSLLLKLLITALCFWYIATRIDFSKALLALTRAHWIYLLIALAFFILSKILSSLRLNIYFRNMGLILSEKINLKLYWLGMFYNLFL